MFQQKAKEKQIALLVTVHDAVPILLEGDASRLTQILVNLIGNAIKFTGSGMVTVEATNNGITGKTIQLSFTVADTGIGIEKNELPHIFDRFKQAEASITRKYGGTGLGLSIVKDLVQLQKGTITVTSEPGKGSAFRFTIPYKIIDSLPATENVIAINDTLPESLKHARVLVVEDNEINQTLMKHLLGSWQLSYTIAASGQQAIEYLQHETFDLVLMDIQMPEMDGYTAAQQIRQQLKLTIPIIAMTAHALAGEREKCIGYGMNDYISKPIKESVLFKIISQYISAGRPVEKQLPVSGNSYKHINLQYMQEISNGNKKYEQTVTEQFIEDVPNDLHALDSALKANDFSGVSQLAHNMKTTVSVMGLTDILQPYLDTLEYNAADETKSREAVNTITNICDAALEDARSFLATL